MILSDRDLKKHRDTLIAPFDDKCVQPSSYDLSLGDALLIPVPGRLIDLRVDDPKDHMTAEIIGENGYVLHPGQCVLASTREVVKCPNYLSSRIEGKSSLGRLFLAVHITAGVIDAGWEGEITLEIVNHGTWDIVLWSGMKIAQVSYWQLTSEVDVPYGSNGLGSHYQRQSGPTPAAGKRNG